MQDEKRTIPFFRLYHWIAIVATTLVFFACSVCAQDTRQRQQECERLFSAAVTAERQSNPIEAELRYEECRTLAQKHRLPQMEATATHRLAVAKARNNKFAESVNLFRQAINLDPKNALILCDFAQLYTDRKDFGEAEVILKNALNIDPNNSKVLYNLGIVIASRGERQTEGLRYLRLAIGEAEAYREIARIYRSQGDISRAEFAEQKAKLADSQPTPSPVLASAPSGNDAVSARPAQREPHKPTPPEVVNRVQQELVELQVREVAEVQQNITATTLPATATSVMPEKMAVAPVATAAVLKALPPTGQPVDPFATVMQQQESPPTSVRRLELPPVDSSLAPSTVRTLPKHSEPLPVVPSSDQSVASSNPASAPNPVSAPMVENKPVSENVSDNVSVPQLVKIKPSPPTETKLPLRTLVVSETTRQTDTARQIDLPSVRASSTSDGRAERAEAVNPLRKISAERSGLIDPDAETSLIAVLPSYSAVGIRKILRTDQNDLPERTDNALIANAPNATEPQPDKATVIRTIEAAEKTEDSPTIKPLPVRNIEELKSPPAVVVRRDKPVSGFAPLNSGTRTNASFAPNVRSEQSVPPDSEPTRMSLSGSRFSTATTPEVLSFAPRREPTPAIHTEAALADVIPADKPVEVAVVPLEADTPSFVTFSPVRLPQITASNVTPAAPPTPAAVPTYPLPIPVDDQPKLAEVRKIETRPSALPTPGLSVLPAVEPAPVVSNPPSLASARPATTPLPAFVPPTTEPIQPAPVVSNPPSLASARRATTPVPTSLFPAMEPVEPFLFTGDLPSLDVMEVFPTSPFELARGAPALSLPGQNEPAGFASSRTSRRMMQGVRVSDKDEPIGTARSRK